MASLARDLPVVGERVAALVGLDRLVGRVRLVDVEEEEEGAILHALEPRAGERRGLVAPALDAPRGVCARRRDDPILVEIEPAGEAARPAHHPGGDRGAGGVAALLEEPRQRRMGLRVEPVAEVVADAVLERQQAGQDRDVGRQGQRDVGVGVLEQDRVLAEPVQLRGCDTRGSRTPGDGPREACRWRRGSPAPGESGAAWAAPRSRRPGPRPGERRFDA